jgi:hypothetical protein
MSAHLLIADGIRLFSPYRVRCIVPLVSHSNLIWIKKTMNPIRVIAKYIDLPTPNVSKASCKHRILP